MPPIELKQHQADRLNNLGLRGPKPGRLRGTYLSSDKIAAVKRSIDEGQTYEQMIMIHNVGNNTITKIKKGLIE